MSAKSADAQLLDGLRGLALAGMKIIIPTNCLAVCSNGLALLGRSPQTQTLC